MVQKLKGVLDMARRRRTTRASPVGRRSATPRRRASKVNHALDFNIKNNVLSGVYGAGRGYVSAINPLRNMFRGAGEYADELAMFIGLQGAKALFGKNRQIRNMANLGQQFESAIFGFQMAKNMKFGTKTEKQGDKVAYYG